MRWDNAVKSIIILCIISTLLFTFWQLKPGSRNPNSPMALQHVQSISIAISQMKYGLTGYRGYRSVHELFYGATGQGDLGARNHDINGWIKGALSINNVSDKGLHYVNHEIGFVNYYKLAFKIFGFNIEGTTYLYFLLLGFSVLIFLITFYNDINLLYILMLFVSSFYVVLTSHNVIVETVTTQRFFPVLATVPSFYIALMVLGKYNRSKSIFIFGTVLQSLILIFTIHVRNSAEYQLVFLASITVLAILWYWKKERTLKKSFQNVNFWPLVLILALFFSQIVYIKIASDEYYNTANKRHPFMQQIYMGLLASKYQDASYFNDGVSVKLVMDKAPSYGYIFGAAQVKKFTQGLPTEQKNEIAMAGEEYDSILRQECIQMIKNEPLLIVRSLLFKLKVYFQTYFSKSQGFVHNVFNIALLLVIILNCCFVRRGLGVAWFQYIIIIIVAFLFALLPVLVTFPIGHSIIDSGLLLTILIYMVFSVILSCSISFFRILFCRFGRLHKKE